MTSDKAFPHHIHHTVQLARQIMKKLPLPRTAYSLLLGIAVSLLASGPLANAAPVTQITHNTDWLNTSTWSDSAAPADGNAYSTTSGMGGMLTTLRTPSASSATFNGDSLTIVAETELLTKNTGSATFTIDNLILNGGLIRIGDPQSHNLAGGLDVVAASTLSNPGNGEDTPRILGIKSNLTGDADLTLDGNDFSDPGLFVFNGTSTYSGTFLAINKAIVDFDQSYTSSSLNLATGTQLRLDDSVTLMFQNVTFGATSLAAGTYSYETLNATYDAFIVDGGSGSIIVAP